MAKRGIEDIEQDEYTPLAEFLEEIHKDHPNGFRYCVSNEYAVQGVQGALMVYIDGQSSDFTANIEFFDIAAYCSPVLHKSENHYTDYRLLAQHIVDFSDSLTRYDKNENRFVSGASIRSLNGHTKKMCSGFLPEKLREKLCGVKEERTCSVCLEPTLRLTNARCDHILCLPCSSRIQIGYLIKCPICRRDAYSQLFTKLTRHGSSIRIESGEIWWESEDEQSDDEEEDSSDDEDYSSEEDEQVEETKEDGDAESKEEDV